MRNLLPHIGFMLKTAGFSTMIPVAAAIVHGENSSFMGLAATALAFVALGYSFDVFDKKKDLTYWDACRIATVTYVLLGFVGAMPYMLSVGSDEPILSPSDSVFESISGFTTTGHTMIEEPGRMSRSTALYRDMTQYLGGVIIILVFIVFFTPKHGRFDLEKAFGLEQAKNVLRKTFVKVLNIYLILLLMLSVMLVVTGQGILDSFSYILGGLSTGGFTPGESDIGIMEGTVLLTAMVAGSVNFLVFHHVTSGKIKEALREELPYLIGIILAASILSYAAFGYGFFTSLFQNTSAATTTGFSALDVSVQPEGFKALLILLMIVGGSSLSTSGGIKIWRAILLAKAAYVSLHNRFGKKQRKVMLWNKPVKGEMAGRARNLFAAMMGVVFFSSVLFALQGYDPVDSVFETVSAVSTTGLTAGITNPAMAAHLKCVMVALMILGRLEIMPFLIVLNKNPAGGKG
ncbi:MAG: hypothetical protein GF416_07140 [Candidatus Altiarchaeales archaeon]|nr:hypothetical protein [Candidatus Altiarchaeales archaeon]MBD3416887.1 hypothetical protein [Candidatus Altiarchaeales archaeon]